MVGLLGHFHSELLELTCRCAVQDEALKNLMMSWYHAGYYTGLYEGRRQTQNPV